MAAMSWVPSPTVVDSLTQVPAQAWIEHAAATVRRAANYSAIVTAFLELLDELYVEKREASATGEPSKSVAT